MYFSSVEQLSYQCVILVLSKIDFKLKTRPQLQYHVISSMRTCLGFKVSALINKINVTKNTLCNITVLKGLNTFKPLFSSLYLSVNSLDR